MAENTAIEWADHTFNGWTGCEAVSPAGCKNCYAEAWAKRAGRDFAERRRTKTWRDPIKWNEQHAAFFAEHSRRQRVFAFSLADWLDNKVPVELLADFLDLVRKTPNLDWLLLSKRIGNWRGRLEAARDHAFQWRRDELHKWIEAWLNGDAPANVWVGATVVNQNEADRDIEKLFAVPARKRFLSIEPMLGPIDLSYWIAPTVHCGACGAYYPPSEAIPDPGGHLMGADKCASCGAENCMGTWWGVEAIEEASRPDGLELDQWDHGDRLAWVICGGESGPNARPMHPDWACSLRDQCAEAGVPFLFKQWGEWRPVSQMDDEFMNRLYKPNRVARLHEDQDNLNECYGRRCIVPQAVIQADGTVVEPLSPMAFRQGLGSMQTFKVGKQAAGRLLDGRTHDEFPTTEVAR